MNALVASRFWRRGDRPGHEAARVLSTTDGWLLEGVALFGTDADATCLRYAIELDPGWRTRRAAINGWTASTPVAIEVARKPAGAWTRNGEEIGGIEGCLDIDLNFSPSTNLLPVRRLALEVGQGAAVEAAWLRFPSFALERLEQRYTRLAPTRYRYESAGGRFVREIEVDDAGLVVDYPEFWFAERG